MNWSMQCWRIVKNNPEANIDLFKCFVLSKHKDIQFSIIEENQHNYIFEKL